MVGIKNAGKSLLVQRLWHVNTDNGALKSTTFRCYRPKVIQSQEFGALTIFDFGGNDDIRLGEHAETFLDMNHASKFVIVTLHCASIGSKARDLVQHVKRALEENKNPNSMVVLINQIDLAPREVLDNLPAFKVPVTQKSCIALLFSRKKSRKCVPEIWVSVNPVSCFLVLRSKKISG